jgi:uncharacterized protein YjbI with pentapeptide repeats
MKANELLSRYRQGERNFRGVDLRGESLRGANLAGIDLSAANLTKTDLRGTKFTYAILTGAQFFKASMGTQRRWAALGLLCSLMLSTLTAFLLGAFINFCFISIVEPSQNVFETGNNFLEVTIGILVLGVSVISLYLTYRKGILATLGAVSIAVAVAFAIAVLIDTVIPVAFAISVGGAFAITFAIAFAIAFAGAGAGAFAITIAITIAIAVALTGAAVVAISVGFGAVDTRTGIFAVAGILAVAVAVAVAASRFFTVAVAVSVAGIVAVIGVGSALSSVDIPNVFPAVGLTFVFVFFIIFINLKVSRRALSGDPRDKLIRDVAVGLSALGGTSFRGADLTNASFFQATVKSTHFDNAKLTHTHLYQSKALHLSRAYNTILSNRTVLNLLVRLQPEPGKSYVGLNLKGANLSGATLADLNLTEADLSGATLFRADIQRANLTKVQALGTDFNQANLTAACLEAWNIDRTTQLEGAICEHCYRLQNQQERRPSSGDFAANEFASLFEEVLNTIDLIFRDGIDWQAFSKTFKTIQVQHEGANLEIQGIEKKGDGVMVVRLASNATADKSTIHQAFTWDYQKALKEVELNYKVMLKDQEIRQKEVIIEMHRQESTNMIRLTESLAQRPITVHMTAITTSEAMQGNDQSQTINFQGDVNIHNSTVSLRDISSQVNNQINQLSNGEIQARLKDLLTQLQIAIEIEPALNETDKAEALEEVERLAKAGQSTQASSSQKLAKSAMNALKGIVYGLTETTKTVEVVSRLVTAIGLLFGL